MLSYTSAERLRGERDEAEDEEKAEAEAFLDGFVQETADGDVDLDVSSANQIKEEAIRKQFDQRGHRGKTTRSVDSVQQAYQKGRELARVGKTKTQLALDVMSIVELPVFHINFNFR